MKMKVYTSYDDVNKDLRILKLKSKIKEERIKLHANQLKSELSPASLAGSLFGQLATKAFVVKASSKIVQGIKARISGH